MSGVPEIAGADDELARAGNRSGMDQGTTGRAVGVLVPRPVVAAVADAGIPGHSPPD